MRGVLSHHVVIRDGKIANYHPYPPTPWNANPRDVYGTPGPYEDAVQNTPIFEENGPDNFKGIDIMRAVRSFDPCLPCGVHMYLGDGKVLETHHSPMFGMQPQKNDRRRQTTATHAKDRRVGAPLGVGGRRGSESAVERTARVGDGPPRRGVGARAPAPQRGGEAARRF